MTEDNEGDVTADGRPEHSPGDDNAGAPGGDLRDDEAAGHPPRDRRRARTVAAWVTTALACALVLFALIAPNELSRLTPGAFVRIPVEALVGIGLVLVLPERSRRVAAALVGVTLGLLTILKILDIGFFAAFARPFNPVFDWSFLPPAVELLTRSIGRAGAVGAVIAAVLLAVSLPILMTLSVLRLTRLVVRHRTTASRTSAVLGVAWVICVVFGVQIVPGVPVAAASAAGRAYEQLRQVPADLQDQQVFAAETAVDAFRDTPGEELLTALRAKDVIIAFVESYGRVAVEHPELARQVGAVLDAGNRRLRAAGFASQSAFLTSPTVGGGSWLAHSTLQSGLWIDNQQRYGNVLASDRVTLSSAFRRAGWRTVCVVPANDREWPEGRAFYGHELIYDSRNLGYRGPAFSFASIPDQYTLSVFERSERARPNHPPVMAEINLFSSHAPWSPVPRLIDWDDVGDGSVFDFTPGASDPADVVFQRDVTEVRTDYGRSIEYSLNTLISYVETYGGKDLVLIFLGDHQPAPVVTGTGASRDVPVTIVAGDPAVLDRISGWGWQDGLNPGPAAPVWRMDAFRDRFLSAFGP